MVDPRNSFVVAFELLPVFVAAIHSVVDTRQGERYTEVVAAAAAVVVVVAVPVAVVVEPAVYAPPVWDLHIVHSVDLVEMDPA